MLYRGGYISWTGRMLSYIEDKENGHLILEAIEKGPYQFKEIDVPETNEVAAHSRLQTINDLSVKELALYSAVNRAKKLSCKGYQMRCIILLVVAFMQKLCGRRLRD